ncbi:uncharacterized protein I206_106496 [Kwoniella pini CBS 10737]|uniref:Uncharacterized protein n=1 Tax=Kwoniella pini CBS 10737 TaxID=1296096 RepID=A0A1B9HUG9_9TREE|nr:uncharacterized protein I206_07301 [Kwoniella pini CBS 10737]OCF46914.1 hypothetical protein I206_07301 [Kwoniella pini CBS 10737]
MSLSERTPLLASLTAEAGPSHVVKSPTTKVEPDLTLEEEANQLISHLKSSSSTTSTSTTSACGQAELAIHLYALYLLNPLKDIKRISIRSRIADSEIGRRVRERLNDKIEDLLDHGCGYESHENEQVQENDDEDLQVTFWKRWKVKKGDDKWLNAVDLLVPPYITHTPSSFLSHPTVRYVLNNTWSYGSATTSTNNSLTASRWFRKIGRIVAPSRLHLLHLLSFLILYGLSLSIALFPKGKISPYDLENSGPKFSFKEVWWLICAGSSLLNSFRPSTPALQRVLLLPIYLTFLLSLFPSFHQISYSMLLLSIPTLTFSLVLPRAPSIPILVKGLLPLSILLRRILIRTIKSAGLIMPLVLGLFLLFSWSMNGDIFRGFYHFSQILLSSTSLPTTTDNVDRSSNWTFVEDISIEEEPIEVGISPFQARLMIFITLSILFIFSIILSAARATMIPRENWDEEIAKRWKGAIKEGDYWEKEYGLVVARQARQAFTSAVKQYKWETLTNDDRNRSSDSHAEEADGQLLENSGLEDYDLLKGPRLPSPLNLITLPLDLLVLITSQSFQYKVRYTIYLINISVAGLLCLPFHVVSGLVDRSFSV